MCVCVYAEILVSQFVRDLGLRSGFDPPDLDRPGRQPHQQGLCEGGREGGREGERERERERERFWGGLCERSRLTHSSILPHKSAAPNGNMTASTTMHPLTPAVATLDSSMSWMTCNTGQTRSRTPNLSLSETERERALTETERERMRE